MKEAIAMERDRLLFGPCLWRVLEAGKGRTLLLSDIALEKRVYHGDHAGAAWAACDLRRYLNGPFLDRFDAGERACIAETPIRNDANPWFGTDGGEDTVDRVFLLSIGEVVQYFGDSGQLLGRNPGSRLFINDRYKAARVARDEGGATAWWWLRSPGLRRGTAAQVYNGGAIHVSGHYADNPLGGVRPALWLQDA